MNVVLSDLNKHMAINSKFLISLQCSGRTWVSNVLGHYSDFLMGLNPEGKWSNGPIALKIYEVTKWNICPSHCNRGAYQKPMLPKLFSLMPAVILVRHPVKVITSLYRSFLLRQSDVTKKRVVEIFGDKEITVENFAEKFAIDPIIRYANTLYPFGLRQKNKILVSYEHLFFEQFSEKRDDWERITQFYFGDVNKQFLKQSILNNIIPENSNERESKHCRGEPLYLGKLTSEEQDIQKIILPKLTNELHKDVYSLFQSYGYV